MRIEFRGNTLCIVAESHEDNSSLQRVGADHDRAMIGISVLRDPADEKDMSLEPVVISLSRMPDDASDMVGGTG